jgi:hypothetical protein
MGETAGFSVGWDLEPKQTLRALSGVKRIPIDEVF